MPMKAITVRWQHNLFYSDGRKRITPLYVKPIDKSSFAAKETTFVDDTKYKFKYCYYFSPNPYKFTNYKVEDYVNVIKDVMHVEEKPKPKPELIKSEFETKPYIKREYWVPFGLFPLKKEPKTEIKSEQKFVVKQEETLHLSDHTYVKLSGQSETAHSEPPSYLSSTVNPNSTPVFSPRKRKQDLSSLPKETKKAYRRDSEQRVDGSDSTTRSSPDMDREFDEDSNSTTSAINADFSDNDNEDIDEMLIRERINTDHSYNSSAKSTSSSVPTLVYDVDEDLRRMSFNRFDDKLRTCLYKKMISLLPIRDKLRLECVSKEWEAIMREEQRCLSIYLRRGNELLEQHFDQNTVTFTDMKTLHKMGVILINKFPNLTKVEVICPLKSEKYNIGSVVEAINNASSKLETVRFTGRISTEALSRFAHLFGNHLKSLDINLGDNGLNDETLKESQLMSCNLREIHISNRIHTLTLNHLDNLRVVKDLDIRDLGALDQLSLEYGDQLTGIYFRGKEKDYLHSRQGIQSFFSIISRFKNLECLEIYITSRERFQGKLSDGAYLDEEFALIENNCKRLKELHLYFDYVWFPLRRLKSFKDLKVLGLFFNLVEKSEQKLDFDVLPALNLTELWMYCDICLKEIGRVLPNMTRLKTLHMKSNKCWADSIHDMINFESTLITLYLEDVIITEKTLEAFIDKANGDPSTHYHFLTEEYESYRQRRSKCRRLTRADIPKNLTVLITNNSPLFDQIVN